MQGSFWLWQSRVRYSLPLPPPPRISFPASTSSETTRCWTSLTNQTHRSHYRDDGTWMDSESWLLYAIWIFLAIRREFCPWKIIILCSLKFHLIVVYYILIRGEWRYSWTVNQGLSLRFEYIYFFSLGVTFAVDVGVKCHIEKTCDS